MKKSWEKPQLVVLVRSQPEESLTSGCKGDANPTGPNAFFTVCMAGSSFICAQCFDLVTS
jgi:hypothetical protein